MNSLESYTTPLPIGVGKKGIFTLFTNYLKAISALEYAAPLPIIIKGYLEFLSKELTRLSCLGSAKDRGTS